ncbi:MAG: Cdc6/Cdc18 family protein [Candidatus Aenigmatarchaeota archaeon]
MYEDKPIIKNSEVFTDEFLPNTINHRDGQMKAVRDDLNPLLNNKPGRSVFIFGAPGTGKTSTSKYIINELASQSVFTSYINCWNTSSRFKILYTILQNFGESLSIHTKGTPTHDLLELLKKKVQEKQAVIILDEVDQLEDDKILYDLIMIANVSVILIANSETALHDNDPRIRSRLASADTIEFPKYKSDEITEILKERAELGLVPGVVKNAQLEKIAERSLGDSRIAINILKIASEEAEKKDEGKITDDDVEKASPKAIEQGKKKSIETLNDHQKLIYSVISMGVKTEPSELYTKYQEECKRKDIEPVKDRTIRKYLDKMIQYKLILAEGEARWRTYSIQKAQ